MERQNSPASASSLEIIDVNIDIDLHTDPQAISPTSNPSPIINTTACRGGKCDLFYNEDLHERQASMLKLVIATIVCIVFMFVEVIFGLKANSISILSDAAHNLFDAASFIISLFSLWATGRDPTPRHSYGFLRIEILGTLVSILMIWVVAGMMVYEAIERMFHDNGEVKGLLMVVLAAIGLVINVVLAKWLGHSHGHGHSHEHRHDHSHEHEHGHETNINMQSAALHALGDAIQNIGVIIGGLIIWRYPKLKIMDMVCTLFFSAIVFVTTFKMLRDILGVLMESTPREIDVTQLENGLCAMDGVIAIHELHIWSITTKNVLLTCHVTIAPDADADVILKQVIGYIKTDFNISHVTIQIERQ